MNCKVCDRDATQSGYCELHAKAYESVVKKFDLWRIALEISWKEYLSEIAKNPLTGEWAKEVAEYLIKNGEKCNVAES